MEREQQAVVDFLKHGAGFAAEAGEVEQIETHAARVFLIGERALKMKRAVRFSFLDFSSLEARRAALEAELRLNRRTAPELYRRVMPVRRQADGSLALDVEGEGEVVEWLLEMARFDQAERLDQLAEQGQLDDPLIDQLARAIADFHDQAPAMPQHGGARGLGAVLDGNLTDLLGLVPDVGTEDDLQRLGRIWADQLTRQRDLLERRRKAGRVRHCHGDLHLANIVRLDGRPVPFDCLEFDEELAATDTLYDLAFLLMDLIHRQLDHSARLLLDAYLERRDDDAGAGLLPLLLSCRAAIRAKTKGFEATSDDAAKDRARAQAEARSYLALALELLAHRPACLVAIGGLSGTGKSSLAKQLAAGLGPAPGAHLLRSDRLRKRLYGVDPATRLPSEAYHPEVSARVYALIARRARTLTGVGRAVIADAVFARPDERRALEAAARDADVPFVGLWLDAPDPVLHARIAARTGDASDATTEVLRQQRSYDLGEISWNRIDAGQPLATSNAEVRQLIERAFVTS